MANKEKKMAKEGPSNALSYKMATVSVMFWFLVTLPWRMVKYAFWAFVIFLRSVVYLLTVLASVGTLSLILFFAGVLLLPSQASQNQFQGVVEDLGEKIVDIANDVVDFFIVVLDCKEILVETWNTIWRFIAAIIHLVFEALDDVIGFGLDDEIFGWAYRSIRLERELRREEVLKELDDITTYYETNLSNMTRNVAPENRGVFLSMMQRKMHKMAKAHVMGRGLKETSTRFTFLR